VAEKISAFYGAWKSPVRPETIGLSVRLDDVQWTPDGKALAWLEGRSGKGVLVFRPDGNIPLDLTEEHNVRGTVGYGGGDFTLAADFAVFAEKNGRLYRVEYAGGAPKPVTPGFGNAAAPAVSPDGRWVIFVHSCEGTDCLAIVDSEGLQWPRKLATGADFYMQAVWNPAGDRIAWVEWNHPNMPWDGALLKCARITLDPPSAAEVITVAGSSDVPIFQPAFSPDGRHLAYLEGTGEWDSLVVFHLGSGEKRVLAEDAVLLEPAWVQGMRVFGFSPDGKSIRYLRREKGFSSVCCVDLKTGESRPEDLSPYACIRQWTISPADGTTAFIGSSASVPDRVVECKGGKFRTVAVSCGERLAPEEYPVPRPFSWRAKDGPEVHGIYLAPHNPRYVGKGLPPAIIHIHGGPTSQSTASYSADAVFFTSRGYAYLKVNYRGSSGYGRSYMRALRGRWGELDVEDAVDGAKALCERGLADPSRLIIQGGSAGGYTVLNALIRHPGFFRAGICLFGVSNLFALAAETHKFEERYLDSLIGPLPECSEKYRAWSPIFHADRIRDPIAIFQGEEDTVVPPNQAEEIVSALGKGGVPHLYRLYPGEGHGWRKTETIVSYYSDVEKFLRQYVLFA
jgi:dipeptidyl aminopeptidase/acylaminoacyl peptidase